MLDCCRFPGVLIVMRCRDLHSGTRTFLALAACRVNDIYREAAKRGTVVEQAEPAADRFRRLSG
jgi:outer membrane protein assembly factor BamE (lipoprotein component of BamABCDE complex)